MYKVQKSSLQLLLKIITTWAFKLCKRFLGFLKSLIWPRGYKTFFVLNSVEHEIFLLIIVKMPTVVAMLTFFNIYEQEK